ncbi:MAG: UPF0104 family protein [Chloroflexi bacterium]|nr:MAG: UPF0104 family protein [Chloroflexota bacterium]
MEPLHYWHVTKFELQFTPMKYLRKNLSTLLKIIVTIVALALVLPQVDLQAIGNILIKANWTWVIIGFLLFNASLVVRAYRWFLLLRGLGVEMTFRRLVVLYVVGNFFNSALPSGFGGDVIRVVETARDVPTSTAAGTVILDRLTGLIMLFVMSVLVLPWQTAVLPSVLVWVIILGAVGGVIGGIVLIEGSLIRRFGSWLPGPLSPVGNGFLAKLLQAVQGCGWQAVLKACGVSVLFNLMLASWWVASELALGHSVSFLYNVYIMPLVSVPLLIPSFAGLGPRELMVPTLFAVVGLTAETAVSISLLVFAITRLSGLFGAPIYLMSLFNKKSKPETDSQINSVQAK